MTFKDTCKLERDKQSLMLEHMLKRYSHVDMSILICNAQAFLYVIGKPYNM